MGNLPRAKYIQLPEGNSSLLSSLGLPCLIAFATSKLYRHANRERRRECEMANVSKVSTRMLIYIILYTGNNIQP